MTSLTLGSSPWGEDCAQTADPSYAVKAAVECDVFVALLKRHAEAHGINLAGATLKTKPFAHDFGTYYEVVVEFDDENEAQVKAAYWLEGHVPESWDEPSRAVLGLPSA